MEAPFTAYHHILDYCIISCFHFEVEIANLKAEVQNRKIKAHQNKLIINKHK